MTQKGVSLTLLAGGAVLTLLTGSLAAWLVPAAAFAQGGRPLLPVGAFTSIADPAQRSVALFIEAGKALQHPRCVNCHPAGDRPLQGEDGHSHQPWVRRGADGHGLAAMRCTACHQTANYGAVGMPGHPNWHLAPASMAWQGKSLAQICT